MDVVAELHKIAGIIDDDDNIVWTIRNVGMWGPEEIGVFEMHENAGKRETAKECLDYIVRDYRDLRGRLNVEWVDENSFMVSDDSGKILFEVSKEDEYASSRTAKIKKVAADDESEVSSNKYDEDKLFEVFNELLRIDGFSYWCIHELSDIEPDEYFWFKAFKDDWKGTWDKVSKDYDEFEEIAKEHGLSR